MPARHLAVVTLMLDAAVRDTEDALYTALEQQPDGEVLEAVAINLERIAARLVVLAEEARARETASTIRRIRAAARQEPGDDDSGAA